MRVSGTAAAMEAAFKPGLVIMRSARDGQYRGRQGTIQIPAELKGIVTGVFGLDQRRMARRKSEATASASHAGYSIAINAGRIWSNATISRPAMVPVRAS